MTRTSLLPGVKTTTLIATLLPALAHAQSDLGGFSEISGGGAVTDPRAAVLAILFKVLTYVGLIAVVVIVIAGIYLITSNGDEGQKDKAKKIIVYALIGIVVITLASAIVAFIIEALS